MSKIVCLIRPHAPLVYFAARIHAAHKLSLVVVEAKQRRGLSQFWRHVQTRRALRGQQSVDARLPMVLPNRACVALYDRLFGEVWRRLPDDLPVLIVPSVNDSRVHERLRQERPDILLDHGTALVQDHVIDTAPLALNLHWGLSPYYRGTHCTEWALLNWDPYNIGVTIHRLAKRIDGGEIVAQARAEVTPQDTVESINMQLTALGAGLVIRALDQLHRGEPLSFHRQDYSRGFLTLNRQWSRDLRRHLRKLLKCQGLRTMLKHPARKERLPIIASGHGLQAVARGTRASRGASDCMARPI